MHFKNAFISILQNFKADQNYVVLGDININYNKIQDSPTIANYANHINRVGCEQLINKSTRITANSSSVIDHIYTILKGFLCFLITSFRDSFKLFLGVKLFIVLKSASDLISAAFSKTINRFQFDCLI